MEPSPPKQVVLRRISLIGNRQVGKTALMLKYTGQPLIISVSYDTKNLQMDDCIIKIQFLDTAGQFSYRKVIPYFYRSAEAILFIYSVTDRQSYEDLAKWINQSNSIRKEKRNFFIIANKYDCPEQEKRVTRQQGEKFAAQNSCRFWQISAESGHNVKELFAFIAEQFYIDHKKLKEEKMKASVCSLI